MFVLRHSRIDLMIFQTIDYLLRTYQDVHFRLLTTSKNNFTYPNQRPKLPALSYYCLSVQIINVKFVSHLKFLRT